MKKFCLVLVFLALLGFPAFGEEQEEVDFLLFLPDSSNEFVNQAQAMIQLDNVANYLKNKNLAPGQIMVYGYAASFVNDIEPMDLSRERALFVVNELKRRGLSGELLADPVGLGSVDLWGSNTDEEDREPNRRVRILLDDTVLTPVVVKTPEPPPPVQPVPVQSEPAPDKPHSKFPWWILFIALALLLLLLFLLKRKKNTAFTSAPQPEPEPVVPVVPAEKIKVLEEEEIRNYAYGLYEKRFGQDGNDIGDWFQAIWELTAYFQAQGYRVLLYWEIVEV